MRALGRISKVELTTTAVQNGLDADDVGGGTDSHDAVQDRNLRVFTKTGDVGAAKIKLSGCLRKRRWTNGRQPLPLSPRQLERHGEVGIGKLVDCPFTNTATSGRATSSGTSNGIDTRIFPRQGRRLTVTATKWSNDGG